MKKMDILICPTCNSSLTTNYEDNSLVCKKCHRMFPVIEGIPILVDLQNLPKHLMQQIHYFENVESLSNIYNLDPWQRSYVTRFMNAFPNTDTDRVVVDSGTGSGYMAVELAKKGFTVIALDLTLKSLVRLKKISEDLGLEDKIIPICCTAEQLPLRNNIAEFVLCNALLEHLPKEVEAIEEISRIAKDHSGLMITVPLSYKYLSPIFLLLNYIHDKRIGHLRRYNKEILDNKFKRFGYSIRDTIYTGHFIKVFLTLFSMLFKVSKYLEYCEVADTRYSDKKWGASNITTFIVR